MKTKMFIGDILIGELELEVTDASMGGMSGYLIPNENYSIFQEAIFNHFEEKGVSTSEDYEYRIILDNGFKLKPEGGICIYHSRDIQNEIFVDAAGNNLEEIRENGFLN